MFHFSASLHLCFHFHAGFQLPVGPFILSLFSLPLECVLCTCHPDFVYSFPILRLPAPCEKLLFLLPAGEGIAPLKEASRTLICTLSACPLELLSGARTLAQESGSQREPMAPHLYLSCPKSQSLVLSN